jgi:hypothetical protein
VAIKLRSHYPEIRCIAYSPASPISKELAEHVKTFVLSIVLGDDVIPRLGVHSVHSLKRKLLREIRDNRLPKYKIIWDYTFSFLQKDKTQPSTLPRKSMTESDNDESISSDDEELINDLKRTIPLATSGQTMPTTSNDLNTSSGSNNSNKPLLPSENVLSAKSIIIEQINERKTINTINKGGANNSRRSSEQSDVIITDLEGMPSNYMSRRRSTHDSDIHITKLYQVKETLKQKYPSLYLPGNIIYIYQLQNTAYNPRRFVERIISTLLCCFKQFAYKPSNKYDSRWAHHDEFRRILISNHMLLDHFPNNVEDSLKYFSITDRIF